MTTMRAIAIDDEPPALRVVEAFASQVAYLKLQSTFTKPQEALNYLANNPVDLIFLDVQMPSITGLDLFKLLPKEAMVIFTTAHSQYAVEGFNLSAVDYLLKPFTVERFRQAVDKAWGIFEQRQSSAAATESQYLVVRADYSQIRIRLGDILYIESLDDYLKIYLEGGKSQLVRMTMKAIMEKLPEADFVRIHRSHILPMKRIESIRGKAVWAAGKEFPIGASYEEELEKRLEK